jgi:hypothetical protein
MLQVKLALQEWDEWMKTVPDHKPALAATP